jgi:DNA-binding response OmpR family regulator
MVDRRRRRVAGHSKVLLSIGGPRPVAAAGSEGAGVLAVLAGRVGRTMAVSEIVAGVWGFEPPRALEKTLQSYIMRLRRTLAAVDGAGTAYS